MGESIELRAASAWEAVAPHTWQGCSSQRGRLAKTMPQETSHLPSGDQKEENSVKCALC